jgi:hypothetical protein
MQNSLPGRELEPHLSDSVEVDLCGSRGAGKSYLHLNRKSIGKVNLVVRDRDFDNNILAMNTLQHASRQTHLSGITASNDVGIALPVLGLAEFPHFSLIS